MTPPNPTNRVLVAGTFDLFHPGHVNLLRRAAEYGPVTVAVNTDEFCTRYKRPPIMTLAERLEVVAACRYVDEAIVNYGDEQLGKVIDDIQPAYVAQAGWPHDAYLVQIACDQGYFDRAGVTLIELPYTDSVSTTKIRERMC